MTDSAPSTDNSKRPRRRSIIREFCLNTSTHALPSIARSESIHNRLFWSISFLAFLAIMIYTRKLSAPMEVMLKNYDGADYNYSQNICYNICHQTYM